MADLAGRELRRPLFAACGVAWLLVGLPIALEHGIPTSRSIPWLAAWLASFGFAALALRSTSRRARLALLAGSAAAVIAMVLLLCDGFEGALLVLVALQLGGLLKRAAGLGWIVAQTALLAIAVAIHWSPPPAILLAPPYLGFQVLAFFVADLLAASTSARRALALANAELVAAQRRVVETGRLEERVRISQELHDAVGHRLTALSLNLEVAARVATGPAIEPTRTALELARGALGEVRAVVERLGDDERIDLAHALRTIAAEMPSPRVHLRVDEGLCPDDPDRALALLRCAQEILTNAARHASSENVWLDIQGDPAGGVTLDARDDGRGADALVEGRGLRGMRERVERAGGALELHPRAPGGFAVHVSLPARSA